MPTAILAFNTNNQLAIRRAGSSAQLAFTGGDLPETLARLEAVFQAHTGPRAAFTTGDGLHVHLAQVTGEPVDRDIHFASIDSLQSAPDAPDPVLAGVLAQLDPHLIAIPYLHLGENDFIYKFRPDKERNSRIYQLDDNARALYQSQLCSAIKALSRANERTASAPVPLDFGAVRYLIPSHFGFCLGVKNAIERAYETLAENPGRRVFMLSELIHNPYVNEDLRRRGLRYLQTDKGQPIGTGDGRQLWDVLTPDDIVIIPAFGATDDDKRRLVRKGIPVLQYDATCMLVEKVWKAARAFGREGFTIIIHGKHEHEETKATFSNARRHAPALIVRNLAEARILTDIIQGDSGDSSVLAAAREKFAATFAGKHTPGFDITRDLQRVAVVNQTTLLMNETLAIIEHLRSAYAAKYGSVEAAARVGGNAKRDTLCYATQVNQDALSRALAEPLDAAIVIGGKNSSNTYQLYRLCEQTLGPRAFFIQSERNIRSLDAIEHYHFPAHGPRVTVAPFDNTEIKTLPRPSAPGQPLRILITGGASCPDGIIQQVVAKINSLLPAQTIRPIDAVLGDLERHDKPA
ncbi:4-hydroxy-3-methylbut-2-enyl diphosphate reductase [Ereboglobus sp. PH5-5]|uniref:4-hydroxy-3-methylbut-2-enyl diphosphate reductase n=1 Tax=Ereboglobus sp. PH5-5 TaxID=2940529 RepID=UPI0024063A46|nr:4-hydroxy-3-methylbut-2-enyl diphosphate reductase [Ereboglobus sp. PH5-5]MDF9834028.1 4-hydroxy-3-methylbut-2-enyl diphosphate reductase [Ereboglobus sp. PH5-5]